MQPQKLKKQDGLYGLKTNNLAVSQNMATNEGRIGNKIKPGGEGSSGHVQRRLMREPCSSTLESK